MTTEKPEFAIDQFKKDHTCAFCGCLIEHEQQDGVRFWLGEKDYTCELCRLEYQDAFNNK